MLCEWVVTVIVIEKNVEYKWVVQTFVTRFVYSTFISTKKKYKQFSTSY